MPFDLDGFAAVWPLISRSRTIKMRYTYITPYLQFSFHSLKTLCLVGVRFDSFTHAIQFLSSVPSITSLALTRIYYSPRTHHAGNVTQEMHLPQLLELHLDSSQAEEFLTYFQSALCSDLRIESLEVREQYNGTMPDLTSFLHDIASTLTDLKITLMKGSKSVSRGPLLDLLNILFQFTALSNGHHNLTSWSARSCVT